MPDLESVPAWGIFAIAVLFLVFKFVKEWGEIHHKKRKTTVPPPPLSRREDTGSHVTADQVAAVVRDQQERRDILDLLRATNKAIMDHTQADADMLEVLKRVADGYELLSKSQSQQTALLSELKNIVENQQKEINLIGRQLVLRPSTPFEIKEVKDL